MDMHDSTTNPACNAKEQFHIAESTRQLLSHANVVDAWSPCHPDNADALFDEHIAARCCIATRPLDRYGDAFRHITDVYHTVNHSHRLRLVYTVDDILACRQDGVTGIILSSPSCEFLFNNIVEAAVHVYWKMGIRTVALACNGSTFAAEGCLDANDSSGLSKEGAELLAACRKFGITVDAAGTAPRAAMEITESAQMPIMYSHTSPRALFDNPWSIGDEQAKACAKNGGVLGIAAYPSMLWDGVHAPSMDRYVAGIEHFVNLVGIDHVGLGLGAISTPNPDPSLTRLLPPAAACLPSADTDFSSMADGLKILMEKLLIKGYSSAALAKLLGENWLRLFRATWK